MVYMPAEERNEIVLGYLLAQACGESTIYREGVFADGADALEAVE